MRLSLSLLVALTIAAVSANPATATIVYSTATFNNFTVVTNSSTQFTATADIIQGGVVAGTITGTQVYGGGTNPFNSGALWGGGANFRIGAVSTATAENAETADGAWTLTVTPNANWSVDGISLFSTGANIANPTFANLTSNGVATVSDLNQGLGNELLQNYNSGDSFINGSDLIFNTGTSPTGIIGTDHVRRWSYDSSGATSLSFNYETAPVTNISNEAFAVDLQLTFSSVPEPSSMALLLTAGMGLLLRRKR